jgi:hypothetical protein
LDKLLRRGVRDAVLEREAHDFSLRRGGVEEHDRGGAGGGDLLRLPALMNDTHTHTERERERERGVSLKKKSNSLSGIAQTEKRVRSSFFLRFLRSTISFILRIFWGRNQV